MNYSRLLNKDLLALLISIIFSLVLFFNSNSQPVLIIQSDLAKVLSVLTYPQRWYQDIFSIKE